MREDVKKFLFIGAEDEKEVFFKKAQSLGIIHFVDPHASLHKDLPPEVQQVANAIKILRSLPPVEQEENYNTLDADAVVKSILSLRAENEKLLEEQRILTMEISRVEVFGNFSLDDLHSIKIEAHRTIQFFVGRPGLFQDKPMPEELIPVASEHGLDYYVAINDQPTAYEKLIEMKIDKSLGYLQERLQESIEEHRIIEHKLKSFAKYNDFLHHALIDKLNKYHLYNTQTYVQEAMGGILFAVEGWVPVNKTESVDELVARQNVHAEEIEIEPTDVIPTFLENQGLSRLGEDLINIYDTPSPTDNDPSPWVLWFFALFFAFIIADAGYGLVYFLIALFLRYKFPNVKGVGKRVLNLFTFLSVACIVWGVLTTSFFGIQVEPNNPLRKLSLVQWIVEKKAAYDISHQDSAYKEWVKQYPTLATIKDPHAFVSYVPNPEKGTVILNRMSDNVMFEMALFIGVLHLTISFLRYARRNIHNIGWALFLIGAYLYFPYYLNVPSFLNVVGGIGLEAGGQIGLQLMAGGIAFAWLSSIFVHGWKGIFEIMVVIQVFADTLSYLRLYALGLAGAIVGATTNEIASGMPLFLGVFLIVTSHFINIVLCTMSGIIHGLRLNFLEWYHYSFEGGGKPFKALKLLKME